MPMNLGSSDITYCCYKCWQHIQYGSVARYVNRTREGITITLACPLMNVALVITVFEVLANKDLATDWL